MLSVETVREVLGIDCPLSDEEVVALRDQMYAMVRHAMSEAPGTRCGSSDHHDRAATNG